MMQILERHLWTMLVVVVIACVAGLFAGHRAVLKTEHQALQYSQQTFALNE